MRGRRVEARRAGMTPSTFPRVGRPRGLVIGGEFGALVFAVGGDGGGDDDEEDDAEDDGDDLQEMEGAVEAAGFAVGVGGAGGVLRQSGEGGEEGEGSGDFGEDAQCVYPGQV